MNVADSIHLASTLEHLGYQPTHQPEEADVIVLNTCVVRQSAEDKALGRLSSLRPLKQRNPNLVINLMGCLVGIKGNHRLKERFPFVDVFSPPSDTGTLVTYLIQRDGRTSEQTETRQRFTTMDNGWLLPLEERGKLVSSFVPIVLGCSHACAFCIIPYRRGVERSRPMDKKPNLAALLTTLHQMEGLERIRFLTSHPGWMTLELLDTVAELPKVMPHIEVPIQAGDDEVLANMRRGYTTDDYRNLVERIRKRIPSVSIATDIIVGFPGESEIQFQRTYDLLEDLKLDVAHLARYSPRPGTLAERRMVDNVPEQEKWRRFRILEELQERITSVINASYLGKITDVLFEEKVRERWRGRTPTNKLVFVQSDEDLRGKISRVQITWTGPWSMQGRCLPSDPLPFAPDGG
jgi:tRNA-2-methylthio-N6-dimethylallyladenosine synthase